MTMRSVGGEQSAAKLPNARAAGGSQLSGGKSGLPDAAAKKLIKKAPTEGEDKRPDKGEQTEEVPSIQLASNEQGAQAEPQPQTVDQALDSAGLTMNAEDPSQAETVPATGPSVEGGMSPVLLGGLLLGGIGLAAAAGGGGGGGGDGGGGGPPPNKAPTVDATQTVAATEDTKATVTVSATDPDNDALTYSAGAGSKGGTLTGGTDGKFEYTPAANFNGSETFTVTVKDADGATATQTITVNVAAVNDAPTVAATQAVTATEDTKGSVTVAGSDIDNDTLAYSASAGSKGGTLTGGAGGTFEYTPAANFNGAETFTITVKDATGATATQTVTFNVAPVNDAPTVDNASTKTITVAEDSVAEFIIQASDVDSTNLSTSITKQPANGTVSAVNGKNVYTPDADFNGTDSFEVTVKDDQGGTVSYTVNVTVTPVNDAPVITSTAAATVAENIAVSTVVYDANATDVDTGDSLSFKLAGADASAFTIDAATGEVRFVASPDFEAKSSYAIDVVATDKAGASTTKAVTVSVTNELDVVAEPNDPNTVFAVNAGDENHVFVETKAGNITHITEFGEDDVIRTDVSASQYSFTSDGDDIVITLNANGEVSEYRLVDVLDDPTAIVFNQATAEDAAGWDFFQSVAPADPPETASLDVDSDNNSNTREVIDAAGFSFTFNESATAQNSVSLINFTENDRIVVSGGAPGQYSFTSDGNDLLISLNNNGQVSDIRIEDVVDPNVFILNEADAEQALGFDFFQFA